MICPTCQDKPKHPPCMECGGTGFSHCCDGPPEQPEAPRDPPLHIMEECDRRNGIDKHDPYMNVLHDLKP